MVLWITDTSCYLVFIDGLGWWMAFEGEMMILHASRRRKKSMNIFVHIPCCLLPCRESDANLNEQIPLEKG